MPSPKELLFRSLLKKDPILAPAVRGVIAAVVSEATGREPDPEVVRQTAETMKERLRLMPTFLGVPMTGVTVAFDWAGLATAGRPFRLQTPDQRRRHIAIWRNIPIGLFGNFLDFWEKMGIFVYLSTLEEQEGGAHEQGGRP